MDATERKVIQNVITRLRGEKGKGPHVGILQKDTPLSWYLEAWVLPSLDTLVSEDRTDDDLNDALGFSE